MTGLGDGRVSSGKHPLGTDKRGLSLGFTSEQTGRVISTTGTVSNPAGLAIDGSRESVYIVNGFGADPDDFEVKDISDPFNVVSTSNTPLVSAETAGLVYDQISQVVFTMDGTFQGPITSIDVSDELNPSILDQDRQISQINSAIDTTEDVVYSPVRAPASGDPTFASISYSDPSNLTELDTIPRVEAGLGSALSVGVDVSEEIAVIYVEDEFANDTAIRVIDISDPSNMNSLGLLDVTSTTGTIRNIEVDGGYAFTSEGAIFDISDPSNISLVANIQRAADIALSGDFLYFGGGFPASPEEIRKVSVSDPENPVVLKSITVTDFAPGVDLIQFIEQDPTTGFTWATARNSGTLVGVDL